MSEIDDQSLMEELSDFAPPEKSVGRSPREQRVLAGFEEIERFVAQNGHLPQHGEDRDIFERLYAVRLDRLRQSPECRAILRSVDVNGILGDGPTGGDVGSDPDDADLQAALGDYDAEDDVTKLVHVRTHQERQAAEEVAQRVPCADFETFRPIFEQVQRDLDAGRRTTTPYVGGSSSVEEGDLFIIHGQKVLVAKVIERLEKFGPNGRVRVIFDNGTESEMLIRSLQRSMTREADANGRRIGPLAPPDLFAGTMEDGDLPSGTIYVLRSKSEHPFIAEHRNLIHKIGVTSGEIKHRISAAKTDPTYLLAEVEVVDSYKLANISRTKFEKLLHKFFAPARMDLELKDRFGSSVAPEEWFMVPLPAIAQAVKEVIAGTIEHCRYDPATAQIFDTRNNQPLKQGSPSGPRHLN